MPPPNCRQTQNPSVRLRSTVAFSLIPCSLRAISHYFSRIRQCDSGCNYRVAVLPYHRYDGRPRSRGRLWRNRRPRGDSEGPGRRRTRRPRARRRLCCPGWTAPPAPARRAPSSRITREARESSRRRSGPAACGRGCDIAPPSRTLGEWVAVRPSTPFGVEGDETLEGPNQTWG